MNESTTSPGRIVTFYSYKGGTGRTMALANTAWVMASHGLRVLAIDWDLESPGLHKYFHPFLQDKNLQSPNGVIELIRDYAVQTMDPRNASDDTLWPSARARILHHATSLDWPFPDAGTIDFIPAGQQDRSYSRTVSTFDWANFFDRQGGGQFINALGEEMRRQYDYVLIDSRTGLSDIAGICTVQLPDIVVNCFTLSAQGIEGALAVASSVVNQRRTGPPVRIVPLLMKVEDAEKGKLEAGRDHVRAAFAPFLDWVEPDERDMYWGNVEIPYKTFYAYEEILAIFGDRAHQQGSLLACFENLSAVITEGRTDRIGPLAEADRRRWLDEFERLPPPAFGGVLLLYSEVDRMWAEWIAAQLSHLGLQAQLQAIDDSAAKPPAAALDLVFAAVRFVAVLLSKDLIRSGTAERLWKLALDREPAGGRFLVPLHVDQTRLPAPFRERRAAELAASSEAGAVALLVESFGLTPPPIAQKPAGEVGPRFPGTLPPVWRVPPRSATFVGRDSTLHELRDRLCTNVTVVMPQALHGLGGVGKTLIAAEYAYRFSADYDLVWWVPAEQPNAARNTLADLAGELGLASDDTVGGRVRAVLEALREGRPYRRWLIIFDNADAPGELLDLIPQGPGHVLVTSRNQLWVSHADPMEVRVFDRGESVALLQNRVERLSATDANRIASELGDLPIAVEGAAAWLASTGMQIEQYLGLLHDQVARMLEESTPEGYPASAAATWRVSLDRLRAGMPAAARLLELCAFFGPDPIPLVVLASEPMIEVLSGDGPSLRDPILQARLVREIGRFALARPNFENGSIQVHRLVQKVFRELFDDQQQLEHVRVVRHILSAANPRNPDQPASWPTYEQLWPHVRAVQLVHDDSDEAQQLIADLVRSEYRRGDFDGSQELAEEAIAAWSPMLGADHRQVLRMKFHLANALRAKAEYDSAMSLDEEIVRKLSSVDDAYALMATRGLAADKRAIGRFDEALELDERVVPRFRDKFGEDNLQTMMAENNLAISLRMVGDFHRAADIDESIFTRRRTFYGDDGPYTLSSANSYGRDLRDVGDLPRSFAVLSAAVDRSRAVLGPDHPDTLRTAKNLAVTLRKSGDFPRAHDLAADTCERYIRVVGRLHPETLGCEMTLSTTYSALASHGAARDCAERVLRDLEDTVGTVHAYSLAARNNLSIILRKAGAVAEARATSERAVELLREAFSAGHPYVAFGILNLSNVYRQTGEAQRARQLDDEAYAELNRTLGDEHMDTIAARFNLALSYRMTGNAAAALEIIDRTAEYVRRTMNETNPRRSGVERMEPANFYIEPTWT